MIHDPGNDLLNEKNVQDGAQTFLQLLFKNENHQRNIAWFTFCAFSGLLFTVTRSHNNCFQLPRVFVNGKFVGGASDLEFLEITGELQDLLKQAKCYKPVKPF